MRNRTSEYSYSYEDETGRSISIHNTAYVNADIDGRIEDDGNTTSVFVKGPGCSPVRCYIKHYDDELEAQNDIRYIMSAYRDRGFTRTLARLGFDQMQRHSNTICNRCKHNKFLA